MFVLRLKHVNKGKCPGKLKKVVSHFVVSVFLSSKILFVRHFAAEELRHVCCRVPWGQLEPVHVYVGLPPRGRLSQAAPDAVQTLPSAHVPYLVGSATGAGVDADFARSWKKRCGEVISYVFRQCLSSNNCHDGHLGTAD